MAGKKGTATKYSFYIIKIMLAVFRWNREV